MNVWVDQGTNSKELKEMKEFDRYWEGFASELFARQMVIKRVDIDQVPYYIDYETYIVQNFDKIKEIHVYTMSELELIREMSGEIMEYSHKVHRSLDFILQSFYGGMEREEDWQRFSEMSGGLEWLYQAFNCLKNLLDKNQMSENNFQQNITQFENIVRNMMEGMENGDYVAVGDVLEYEFRSFLEELDQELNKIQVR